jgi:hypothetical protein
LKPETLQLMKSKGTYLGPALMPTEYILGKLANYPSALQAKAKEAAAARSEIRNALRLGMKIGFGAEAAVYPHGQNAKEFKQPRIPPRISKVATLRRISNLGSERQHQARGNPALR